MVEGTHFLQTHHIGIEHFHGVAEVMDFKPPRQAQALHAFVDVVSGDFECVHALAFKKTEGAFQLGSPQFK
jgi:hypothetical protein